MSKRDFVAVAAIVAEVLPDVPEFQAEMARRLADHFAEANPRFRRDTFIAACGVDEDR